jgi:predicted homoserine dehydrogenase-like protein
LECNAHVVWMNAEADLVLGRLVDATARAAGLIATSDAGDQHGVLARLLDEIELWGWQIVQAGNIKGFLDRAATPQGLAAEAAKRRLDPRACCAYTDGTKLGIEMALIGNARGLRAPPGGMRGPKARHVKEALGLFDLDAARARPEVDYLLGAEPGGGVYAIGVMDDPDERFMLDYYKLGPGPYYLHYRPCHLCHVETPLAIASAALGGRALLRPGDRLNDVFAVAKRDLPAGHRLVHAIGSADVRGELLCVCEAGDALPIGLVHDEPGGVLRRPVRRGEIIPRDAVTLANDDLLALLDRQRAL